MYYFSVAPLHFACFWRNKELIELLLKHGANPNVPRTQKNCEQILVKEKALHIAIEQDNREVVSLLLSYGALLSDLKEKNGKFVENWELCVSKEMKDLLNLTWSPTTHKHFNDKSKKIVFTILLLAKRLKWPIGKDNLYIIISKSVVLTKLII